MTLSPVESRDVRGVPATKYKINTHCAHPDCTEPSEPGAHHCFRRSQIIGDSYFVSIDGGPPIPHAVGLCSEHHRQITDNQAWIRLEHDVHGSAVFSWAEKCGLYEDGTKQWELAGDLDPQPGQLSKQAKPKPVKPKTEKSERRPSQVLSVRCPKDAVDVYGEDGIALLKDLIAECARLMPHRDYDSPPYFVLMDALGWFVLNFKPGEDG